MQDNTPPGHLTAHLRPGFVSLMKSAHVVVPG